MKTDPAIKRTRDARRDISERVDDDPVKMVKYYIEMQKRFPARIRPGPADAGEGGGLTEPAAETNGGR